MKNIIIALALCLFAFAAQAQQSVPKKPSKDLVRFFAGKWQGEGEFASGKAIAADLYFRPSLDSTWLEHQHTDRAPHTYKATSWWGVDQQSGAFIAYIFDSSGGHRQFTGEGWDNGRLILTYKQDTPKGIIWQHFIYEKLSESEFKMTFEVSRDGTNWRMIDYLVFQRVAA